MDVTDQPMADAAIKRIFDETGRLDVVIHNAGHMVLGPAEAFTVEQVAQVYDVNVLSTQRVNRAALPYLRAQRDGLLVWVGSSSSRGTPPYLAPYFAAKAAEDAFAVSYAAELARFGIGTLQEMPACQSAMSDADADPGEVAPSSTSASASTTSSPPGSAHEHWKPRSTGGRMTVNGGWPACAAAAETISRGDGGLTLVEHQQTSPELSGRPRGAQGGRRHDRHRGLPGVPCRVG
jgi:NAD(P)-dependent dehydrogenase (short-subunit alcohol dehydrogenase family)